MCVAAWLRTGPRLLTVRRPYAQDVATFSQAAASDFQAVSSTFPALLANFQSLLSQVQTSIQAAASTPASKQAASEATTYRPSGLGSEIYCPPRLGPGGLFSSLGLQIPFYKRGGFLGNSAHVCSSLVKPKLEKSMR